MADPLARFTPQQRDGVTATGQSLLLSAAAGSGKTAVLSQRCVHLVCRATPACEIDELLVVAFNEAAAIEMKSRIQSLLEAELLSRPTDRLRRQVALVDHAAISTLHGFCLRLLKQHFQRVGIDPNFTVLDPDDACLLRGDVARQLFDARYEEDPDGLFRKLINDYGNGDDERIIEDVLRLSQLLDSVLDPQAWCNDAIARLQEAADLPLARSTIGQAFLQLLRDEIAGLLAAIADAEVFIGPRPALARYMPLLAEWHAVVAEWQRLSAIHPFDEFSAEVCSHVEGMINSRLPSMASAIPDKEAAKKRMDAIKNALKGGFLVSAVRVSEQRWRETISSTLAPVRALLGLVADYRHAYAAAKSRIRAVDFADQERFALMILSDESDAIGVKPSDVAIAMQRRFKQVMVDEYQDINEVQDAILRLVSRESGPQDVRPNLFAVGDVKQSIYRFRLAEPLQFLDRLRRFRADETGRGRVIDLQENFRSRAPLLASINAIFARLMTSATAEIDYDDSQQLKPGVDYPTKVGDFTGAPIELHVLPAGLATSAAAADEGLDDVSDDVEQDEFEAALIARHIRLLLGMDGSPIATVMERDSDGALIRRDARPSDIVILLRAQKFSGDRYAAVLRTWGISAHAESTGGLFAQQEIRDIRALLAVLDNPQQDIPLAAVLRSPICRFAAPEEDLATVRLAFSSSDPAVPFHRAVTRYADEKSDPLAARLIETLKMLSGWRERMRREPIADVLRSVYDEGLLAFYRGLPEGDQRCANLEDLYRRASQFGTFAKQGLSRFLSFLSRLERDSDTGQASLDAASDAVRIMTIHRSKGLEWPIVFVGSLGKRFNRKDAQGMILAERRAGIAMNEVDAVRMSHFPSMASHVLGSSIESQMTAEEIRTLYVALTRAREKLILVGSAKTGAAATAVARWAGHIGPLPTAAVRSAGCAMQWMLDIAGAGEAASIKVTDHEAADILQMADSINAPASADDRLQHLRRLMPLSPIDLPAKMLAAAESRANAALQRIAFEYPHEAATRLAAARSVTAWSKNGAPAITDVDRSPIERKAAILAEPEDSGDLDLPTFLSTDARLKSTDLGTFTHTVLEHFDYAANEAVAEQISQLVQRGILTPRQAEAVDSGAVEWFIRSDVGRLFAKAGTNLHRELPVYLPADAGLAAEAIMLRGRLDAYVAQPGGGVIVDYKTDRVKGDALHARADFYAGQLRVYADAMRQITNQPVASAYLVFLQARTMVNVLQTAPR